MKRYILVLLPLIMASCAADGSLMSWQDRMERDRIQNIERLSDQARMKDAKPNEYAYNEGTKHGCSSGYNAGGDWTNSFQKDVNQYVNDKYYKTGWDDGYAKCKSVADIAGGAIDNSLRTAPLSIP